MRRLDPFAIAGLLAVITVIVLAQQGLTTPAPSTAETHAVTLGSGSNRLQLTLDSGGMQHGHCRNIRGGRLVEDWQSEHGMIVWKKTYWPNGQLHTHRLETWQYQLVTDHYDEDGAFVERTEGW